MQTIVYAALVNLSPAPATPILDRLESSPLWVRVVAARAVHRRLNSLRVDGWFHVHPDSLQVGQKRHLS